jgi:hypothetical protein
MNKNKLVKAVLIEIEASGTEMSKSVLYISLAMMLKYQIQL